MPLINTVQKIDRLELLSQFPDKHFDLFVDDPPFFDGPDYDKFFGNKTSKTGVIRLQQKTKHWKVPEADYFDEVLRVSKNQIIWGVNYYNYIFPGAGRIIWDKCNGASTFSDCEIAYCSLHDSVRMFRYMWNGMMQGKSIAEGHIVQGNKKLNEIRIHPTQKPVNLYLWLLRTYAKPGYKIGCGHTGSGSDRIAAHMLNMHYQGTELSDTHYINQEARYKEYLAELTKNPYLFNHQEMQTQICI